MKENSSSIDRVYGKDVSEEDKETFLSYYGEEFREQVNAEALQEVMGKEREKTKEEIELISFCNKKINELRKKYNLESFIVPENNFHIIPKDAWHDKGMHEKHNMSAFFSAGFQSVAMEEIKSNIGFAKTIYHELIHFNSYQALVIQEKGMETYRYGLIVTKQTGDGPQPYFKNLNEGLTEELAKRFLLAEYDSENPHPVLQKEIQEMKYMRKEIGEKLHGSNLEKLVHDQELIYATLSETDNDVSLKKERLFSYKEQRSILNTLTDKLYEQNKENVKDREEIFEMFAEAMFTGNIYELGKMIDTTFGKGTLRKIGELDENIEEQEKFIKSL